MKGFTNWMETNFVPVAAKIGSQQHLVAVRDAFIAIMPVTMAGSFAVLFNVFFRDLPGAWGMTSFVESMGFFIGIDGKVWWGTIAIIALAFVFSLGYKVAESYDVNPLGGGLVTFAAYMANIPEVGGEAWGNFNWAYTNANGLFAALFVGLVGGILYSKLMKTNLTIKMPDSVPPAVSKAFAAVIPGTLTIFLFGFVSFVLQTYVGQSLPDLINTYVQKPFLALSQGYGAVLIVTIAVQLLWFFGLHGTNVLAAILDGVYATALNDNMAVYEATKNIKELPYLWTRGSFDAYAWMGGTGCTLALIIAIFLVSKREDSKAVAKLSAPMGLFNINEPVMFGLPLVLSPIYFIPFLLVTPILVTIAYAFTAMGLIPPVYLSVPWIMPPVIYAFLATGGNILAAGVALLNLVIAVLIWMVFVKMANNME